MKLKQYDIKKIYSDAARRRLLIAESTRIAQLREGIEVSLEYCLASYDQVMREKFRQ
jgi:hypothetical protein